jgi:septal ring factor EnvC (AmiA/AmiB activator)
MIPLNLTRRIPGKEEKMRKLTGAVFGLVVACIMMAGCTKYADKTQMQQMSDLKSEVSSLEQQIQTAQSQKSDLQKQIADKQNQIKKLQDNEQFLQQKQQATHPDTTQTH